jgi:cell division transport system permease protein
VKYPTAVVNQMQRNFRFLNTGVAILAVVIALLVIILIDNTIRLAMFSNRFLIKTMQMVGATRGFIARPLDARAVVNGFISGIMAIAVLYLCILAAEKYIPGMKALRDNYLLAFLFAAMVVIGIAITLLSTHRSVVKYLRMKLDELY